MLWPRSDIAGRELPDALDRRWRGGDRAGGVLHSHREPDALGIFTDMLEGRGVEAVAFFSPSAADGLARAFDGGSRMGLARLAGRTEVASIGPSTSAALEATGAPVTIEAKTRSGSELASAILRQLARRKGAA